MKTLRNISKPVTLLALLTLLGCQPKQKMPEESAPKTATSENGSRGYDPLGLPGDRAIIPKEHPKSAAIAGKVALVDVDETQSDTTGTTTKSAPMTVDTVNSQAYRIQLYTSKLYSEARHEERVAEEIFDRPVFLDYEVPYYKIRVGSFADRDKAEAYLQKVKAAGYKTAWVVMVNVGVKEAPPIYRDVSPSPDGDTTYTDDQNGEG